MPWFINWSDYRPSFETQASRILGHPVHVLGTARASILPSPSVTFTNVAVGDPGKPLMTVSRFAVTVELLPLIQGQIHVVAMKLDEPAVHVVTAADGAADWLRRTGTAEAIAPDSVALTDVSINNGSLDYSDASTGVAFAISGIDAAVEATSLAGPWKVTGSYAAGAMRPSFALATGRVLEDGSIHVKVETSPPQFPLQVDLDGALSLTDDAGLKYAGTYELAETPAGGQSSAPASAPGTGADPAARRRWESEGTFTLTRQRLAIDKAVLSRSAADGAGSVAGSLTVTFGDKAAFDAAIEAKQLDLDRVLGGGASRPASVADAVRYLVGLAATAPSPPIPGRVAFTIPAMVIGSAVAQDIAFTAATTADGWAISGLHAGLPGQASVAADGNLTTGRQLGFAGRVRFEVAQPAVLAGWWRGTAPPVSAVPLPAFAVGGDAEIAIDRFALTNATARVGDSNMNGSFSWSRDRQYRRELDTDLKADHIDVGDLSALAGLITGSELADVRTLADRFQLRFAADGVAWRGIAANKVAIDAGYADDTLKVVQIAIGDLGGASVRVTSGRIDGLTTASASGHLEAQVNAAKVDGLARVAATLAPDSALSAWLGAHAPLLSPAAVDFRVAAPAAEGSGAYGVALSGNLGPTTMSATLRSDARPSDAWSSVDHISVALNSHDSAALARQLGFDAAAPGEDSGAHVALDMEGAPAKGLATTVDAAFSGLSLSGSGTTTFDNALQPGFNGTLKASAEDVAPFLAMAGIALPGLSDNDAVNLAGTLAASPGDASLAWKDGRIAGRSVSGNATLAPADGRWRLSGNLAVDLVDLRWLAAASIGAPLVPGPDPAAPWSKAPFSAPNRGGLTTQLALAVDRFVVSDALAIDHATAALNADPERVDVNITDGALASGKVSGGLSMRNAGGNVSLAARLTLRGASLAPFVWRVEGESLASGTFDATANLEASGRSLAAVVASLTGGGSLALHDGTVRAVNADAVAPVIRVSDRGEPYAEDALRAAVESQLGLGSIAFTEAGAAFAVAQGTVRLNDLVIDGGRLALSGDTALDLNKLAIDSAWTYTFKSAAGEVEPASLGVAFRGPLAAPARTVDVVPLSAYLSTRQAARMIQVLAIEDADRLEQERFAREILRFRDEPMRADRERRASAAAAEAQAQAAHAALEHAAELTAAARDTAVAAATAAATDASNAHAHADAAAASLAKATSDRDAAVAAEVATVTEVADARTAANAVAGQATDLAAAATAADNSASAATSAAASAKAAADKVEAAIREANSRLDAARGKAADADAAAAAAARESDDADTALQAAGRAVSDALTRSDAARAALAAAEHGLAAARQEADRATTVADAAMQAATTSDAERARLAMLARVAAEAVAAAKSDRDAARQAFEDASTGAANAQADVDRAEQEGAPAFTLAARKTAADNARQALQIAHDRYAAAETNAADLAVAADAADAAAEKAANIATLREAEAAAASAAKTTAVAALEIGIKARDAAAVEVAAAAEAAKTAGAAFDSAQAHVRATTDQVAGAAAVAKSADAELSGATRAAAATAAGSAGFASQQAVAAQNSAVADAAAARAKADAATVASADAGARLSAAVAAHDLAVTNRVAAEAARVKAAKVKADADAAALTAEAQAKTTADVARQRTAEAAAAAAALQAAAPLPVIKSAVTPLPRQKPQKPVTGAVAGDGPLQLVPLAQ